LKKILQKELYPFYLFFILVTFLVARNPFFWDTIQLGSRHAHFFFQNNLKLALLPDAIDSGHIPAFGYSIAILWKIFGKSLPVGHFFMLPFLIGIVYQSKILLHRYFSSKNIYLVLVIFLADPTVLAQATLVTPDIPLVFFFLLLLNAILNKNPVLQIIAVCGLALISMRGMIITALLFAFDVWINFRGVKIKSYFRKAVYILSIYLPGALIASTYLLYHYAAKGWVGYHKNSPWAPCFEPVDFAGFIRNLFIYGWRLIDFGRILLWVLFALVIKRWWLTIKLDHNTLVLTVLAGLFLVVFPISMLMHKNLLGHRYLLPVYLLFALLVCFVFFEKTSFSPLRKKVMAFLLIIGLFSGNFIVYPHGIAMGWDSTLAYLPYLRLRNQAIAYLETNKIPIEETGTDFPNTAGFRYVDLKDTNDEFALKDLQKNKYFLYSNVFNDITDEEYTTLHTKWILVKNFNMLEIDFALFKNPK
jgi:hypothetical protein